MFLFPLLSLQSLHKNFVYIVMLNRLDYQKLDIFLVILVFTVLKSDISIQSNRHLNQICFDSGFNGGHCCFDDHFPSDLFSHQRKRVCKLGNRARHLRLSFPWINGIRNWSFNFYQFLAFRLTNSLKKARVPGTRLEGILFKKFISFSLTKGKHLINDKLVQNITDKHLDHCYVETKGIVVETNWLLTFQCMTRPRHSIPLTRGSIRWDFMWRLRQKMIKMKITVLLIWCACHLLLYGVQKESIGERCDINISRGYSEIFHICCRSNFLPDLHCPGSHDENKKKIIKIGALLTKWEQFPYGKKGYFCGRAAKSSRTKCG